MSVDFPIPLLFANVFKDQETGEILLEENKSKVIVLEDGRKVHILIANPATRKPAPEPLTEEQKQNQYFLAIAVFFVVLAICMVCTLIASV